MSDPTIGFIGGGRIARVFRGGWTRAGRSCNAIVVSDTDSAALARLQEQFSTITAVANDNPAAAAQDIVFVALHPPAIPEALAQVKSSLKSQAIVVSLAPKWTIAKLADLLDGFDRLARAIPNAPSVVGTGFNPVTYSSALPMTDRDAVRSLFAPLGNCCEVVEEKLEAYAILTGMGPTYFWPLLYELTALGEAFGLSRSEAESGVRQMLAGTVATMLESGLSAAGVQDLIPVKPLADVEQAILDAYRAKLPALYQKIKP
jgi:pyrroline-5-carboxylate reductase